MKQAILDTNILVSALRSRRGHAFLLIEHMFRHEFQPIVSVPLVFEYEAILTKQFVPHFFTAEEISGFVDSICNLAKHQEIYYLWRPFLKDPFDDHVLELAFAAKCNTIVTYNTKDFREAEQLGIQTISPKEFIQELEKPANGHIKH